MAQAPGAGRRIARRRGAWTLNHPVSSVFSELPLLLTRVDAPADYDKVYIYSADLEEIKKRFPPQAGNPNLIVFKPDAELIKFGHFAPLPQMYVDLWNLPEWYAKDFIEALKSKLW